MCQDKVKRPGGRKEKHRGDGGAVTAWDGDKLLVVTTDIKSAGGGCKGLSIARNEMGS